MVQPVIPSEGQKLLVMVQP